MNNKVVGIAKKIVTVGAVYALAEMAYQAGKGSMLGVLIANDITAKEMNEALQTETFDKASENFRLAIINDSAKLKIKKLSKEES